MRGVRLTPFVHGFLKRLAVGAMGVVFPLMGTQAEEAALSGASEGESESESERLAAFFEETFQAGVDRSPRFQAMLGIKKDYGSWDEMTEAEAARDVAIAAEELARLRSEFDFDALNDSSKVSYRLFEHEGEDMISAYPWRHHGYPINQMFGAHSSTPSFLINYHRIDNESDARDYISRLRGIPAMFDQVIDGLERSRRMGIIAPAFVFPKALSDCRNLLTGRPFNDSDEPSTLLEDFIGKLEKVEALRPHQRRVLEAEAVHALVADVLPAYRRLMAYLEDLHADAEGNHGVWNLPMGGEYYSRALRRITTTTLSAQEIHRIGLEEVARIHGEMEAVMRRVEFEGTLKDFFRFMREDPRFYLPNTDEGREQYLEQATAIVDRIRGDLDRMFGLKPKAGMIVKRVEPFREKSTGKAFYMRGTPDGSRPGVYYANLYDMSQMPTYQMEGLAYHEGIPGHHMQLSISQELEDIPKFRKFGFYVAYSEGWGLYCELLPKEFGYYEDPYSDFGRLSMELWRAARLVVDTGLHHYRWSREKAIDYLVENTPDPKGECVKAIERYMVMPGQATGYKIGMLKILELRKNARERLGDRFDLSAFHDTILANGPMPLDMLEETIDAWIEASLGD